MVSLGQAIEAGLGRVNLLLEGASVFETDGTFAPPELIRGALGQRQSPRRDAVQP